MMALSSIAWGRQLALLALVVLWSTASASQVWTKARVSPSHAKVDASPIRNRRLQDVPHTVVEIDHPGLVRRLAALPASVDFDLDGEVVSCDLSDSGIMPPGLTAKFPSIKSLSGPCTGGSRATLNIDGSREGSVSATIYTDTEVFYADSLEDGKYMVYSRKDARLRGRPEQSEFSCGVTDHDDQHDVESSSLVDAEVGAGNLRGASSVDASSSSQTTEVSKLYVFRMAMLTSPEYANFHGNTKSSVMQAVVDMMTRVNGIYLQELGVFFQLIEESDRLLCYENYTECEDWPDDSTLLDKNDDLMEAVGVTKDMYDIGHSVSGDIVGVAGYPSMCTENKARGTTGVKQPLGDPFWVDYVSHEIGHQMNGAHTFRDCRGSTDRNLMLEGAVEPGSGSSIMGYAGICSEKNLQSNSDPYFNAVNLGAMLTYIETKANEGCGQIIDTNGIRPVVSTQSFYCEVPRGSYVQLAGDLETEELEFTRFSWDRTDTGYKSYLNTNVARFRSWIPTQSKKRFLPNLFYLANGITGLDELPPSQDATSDETLEFTFTARSKFEADATSSNLDVGQVGSFGTHSIRLTYRASFDPLRFTSEPDSFPLLRVGTFTEVTWTGAAQVEDEVEILLALNELVPTDAFDYARDTPDLDWVFVGRFSNVGKATMLVPSLFENVTDVQIVPVLLMIRSIGSDDCFHFDLLPNLELVLDPNSTFQPTQAPTQAPTPGPEPIFTLTPTVVGSIGGSGALILIAIVVLVWRKRSNNDGEPAQIVVPAVISDSKRKSSTPQLER